MHFVGSGGGIGLILLAWRFRFCAVGGAKAFVLEKSVEPI